MHTRATSWVMRLTTGAAITACAIIGPAMVTPVLAQGSSSAAASEGLREHIDEIEDAVDSLMDWRHVLVGATRNDAIPPTAPATTLITVSRSDMEKLSTLIDATVRMLPPAGGQTAAPRGDLRAHVMKAQEISREMFPASTGATGTSGRAAPGAAGTSGTAAAADGVTIDRTALERLKVEVEALEKLARRQQPQP